MGAAEDQRVDFGALQRRAVGASHRQHLLVEGRAVLDERRQVGGLHLGHLERAPLPFEGSPVGAALDRVRRRQHPDPAAVGDRRGDLGLRLDHRHHLHPACSPPTSRATSVPIEVAVLQAITSSLAPRSSSSSAIEPDPFTQAVDVARPVGEHRRVAEVDEVLLGQRDQALVQHREAADPGVEHRDRLRAVELRAGRGQSRQGLYDMKKIVTTTIRPASVADFADPLRQRHELIAERVAGLQVALGELSGLGGLRPEEAVLEAEAGRGSRRSRG